MMRGHWILSAACLLFMVGCGGEQAGQPTQKKAADCKADDDCVRKFICKNGQCIKGKRTQAEIMKMRAEKARKDAEKRKKRLAKRNKVKPGEGRLRVRICPFFKNTSNASSSLYAVHQKTKKKHSISLHLETPENAAQSVYTFPSLPLGTYDISLKMGVQIKGTHDLTEMNCHPDGRPCRGGTIREMKVVLPSQEEPLEKKEDGSFKLPSCDFLAE